MNIEFSERVGIYTCWRGDEKIAVIRKSGSINRYWSTHYFKSISPRECIEIFSKIRELRKDDLKRELSS